ncbi:tRNA:m(4)X modification enzyme TRM13 (tRNA methylase 13), partial [Durusdinium trenchii]
AVLVEYGSGKGGLAAAVLRLSRGLRCVLVEREPRRHKFENKQEQRDEQVLRLRVDIADFHLKEFLSAPLEAASLPSAVELSGGALSVSSSEAFLGPAERLQELWQSAAAFQASGPWPPSRLVACAKHLCGGATDIALRSLKAFPAEAGSKGGVMVCVATCCHHRCDVDSYVNRPFLEALGLCNSPEDFLQLVSTAGWAVGGEGRRDVQKRRVGMMAKRILDLGRVAWLRKELHLDDASLTEYISKAVTPENMAITAGAAKKPARGCLHILKLEEAQAELQFWLRRLLRDRLDQQRKRILAQGQVGAALCKMYACAALQQLEEAAEMPAPRGKEKKGTRLLGGQVDAFLIGSKLESSSSPLIA